MDRRRGQSREKIAGPWKRAKLRGVKAKSPRLRDAEDGKDGIAMLGKHGARILNHHMGEQIRPEAREGNQEEMKDK